MTHGTLTGYVHHKCRCDGCRAAHRVWTREHRSRNRASGRCAACSRRVRSGHYLCVACRTKYAGYQRRRHASEAYRVKHAEYVRSRYLANKESGLCAKCGVAPVDKFTRCMECRAAREAWRRQRRALGRAA